MAALTEARPTPERNGDRFSRGVGAGEVIHQGAIVALDATGFAVPGSTATTLTADGMAKSNADNTDGGDGDALIEVARGVFRFGNSAGADEITGADIGNDAFIVDDQTLAKTNGGNTRSIAGTIEDVDAEGVWVRFA